MKTTLQKMLVVAVSTLLLALGARAGGERTNIQGMGMARTFVASSRGIDAVGINPANLAWPEGTTVTLSLMPTGVHVGSDFLTYDIYTTYFTGVETENGRASRELTDFDKRRILDAFSGGTGSLAADADIRPIGLSVRLGDFGAVALTLTERFAAEAVIPHEYAEFVFFGNTPGSVFDFSSSRAKGSWTREYALSFGAHVPSFGLVESLVAGLTVKLVHGFGYFELVRFNNRLVTTQDGVLDGSVDVLSRFTGIDPIRGNAQEPFSPFPNPVGSGFGIDLGLATQIDGFITIAASVTDIGSIDWTRNIEETYSQGSIHLDNPLDEGQRNSVENSVRGSSREGEAFSTSLPTTLRLGVAMELTKMKAIKKIVFGELMVAADYNQGVTDAPGGTRAARVSLGLEYRPWSFLPLRTGVSFGGADNSNLALGLGFHLGPVNLDLASENLNWLFSPGDFSYGSLAVGLKFKM